MRIINHVKRWNKWRKHNLHGPVHKFLVLIGFIYSPSMEWVLLDEEIALIERAFKAAYDETAAANPEWIAMLQQELTDDESVVK